jgi:trigger factor
VAEQEQIEVSEAEVDEEVEAMAEGAGEKGEELKKIFDSPPSRQSLKDMLVTRKTLKRLVDIALASETEREKPAEPTEAVEPTESIEPTELTEPTETADPEEHAEST